MDTPFRALTPLQLLVSIFLGLLPHGNVVAQECSTLNDCISCMNTGGYGSTSSQNGNISNPNPCSWGTNGQCVSDCTEISERHVACYSHWAISSSAACRNCSEQPAPSYYATTAESLCSSQQQDLQTLAYCANIPNCSACMDTYLAMNFTDGLSTSSCNWFEEGGYCSAAPYDPDGEDPAFYCREDDSSQATCHFASTDCTTCVGTSQDANGTTTCTWWGGGCSDWCGNSNEAECFSAALYPDSTVEEICQASAAYDTDYDLCDEDNFEDDIMNCEVCTSRIKSDGTPCHWANFVCIPGVGSYTGVTTCEGSTTASEANATTTTNEEIDASTNGDAAATASDESTNGEVDDGAKEETPESSALLGPLRFPNMLSAIMISLLVVLMMA